MRQQIQPLNAGKFNNVAFNENMVNGKSIITITSVFGAIVLPISLVGMLQIRNIQEFLYIYIYVGYCTCLIILPVLYFASYPRKLKGAMEALVS